jgi:hypothetical protein
MFLQAPGPPPKRQEERELRIQRMLLKSELSFAANPLPTRLDAAGALVDEVFRARGKRVGVGKEFAAETLTTGTSGLPLPSAVRLA